MNRDLTFIIYIVLIDIFIGSIFMYYLHPEESMSLGLIIIVPIFFVINIIIGILLKVFGSKLANIFFVNSLIGSIIVFILFFVFTNIFKNYNLKHKTFSLENSNYYIWFYNGRNEFEISNNSNNQIFSGKFERFRNDSIRLNEKSLKNVYIVNNFLFNFPTKNKKIKIDDL